MIRSFAVRFALREGRAALRRMGMYALSIALGVAALVSIHAFRDDVERSVRRQAELLLGADARIASSAPFADSVEAVADSLAGAGHPSARVTTLVSMVLAPRTGAVRLLQLRGVEPGYPFYGEVTTRPGGGWERLADGAGAFVDPAVMTQLGVGAGDTLAVGGLRLPVLGSVEGLPTDLGFQSAVGPRVWLSREALEATGLLAFGSLARHERFLLLPRATDQAAVAERYRPLFRRHDASFTTADNRARGFTRSVEYLGRYLGLVGLAALLLGGIGVASAVHVFVTEKRTTVAVLRCLGARQWTAFRAYLFQAAVLGLGGGAVGVAVGLGVQRMLPVLLRGAIPVEVTPALSPAPIVAGLGIGLAVAVLFALAPLLEIRNVSPLRALRSTWDPPPRRVDPWQVGAWAALGAGVVGLSVLEAPERGEGLAFAVALFATGGLLRLSAAAVIRLARALTPRRGRYALRQGLANLFRPGNQTVAVVLALGFGAFVVGTLLQVQSNLARELAFDRGEGRPNLLLFDVQADQRRGVTEMVPGGVVEETPLVPSRLSSIGGRTAAELRADTTGERPDGWALRREYRHTWREELAATERLVAGTWWDEAPEAPPGMARVSLETDLAESLAVGLGDTLTWDVGGVSVASVVASLREVDWNRFATNFFVVFEPGFLERAPQSWVVLARVPAAAARADFQRRLVQRYPNVSVLDVARVQETLESILGQVDRAVRFLAAFCAAAGLLVLAGALAASRHRRMREGALLKTLGARRGQVLGILLVEYAALGSVAALSGLVLAVGASALLLGGVFETDYRPALAALVGVWLGVVALTVVTGLLGSRSVLARPPLPVLREVAE